MDVHYLDLDYSETSFYEFSKVEKEGFQSFTNAHGDHKGYKQLFNKGVFGILQSIGIRDRKNGVKQLSIRVQDGDDIYVMSLPLYDNKGQIENRFAEPLIAMMPNLKKEGAYRFFPWAMESETLKDKQGNPRKFYGLSVKLADIDAKTTSDKVEQAFTRPKKDEKFDSKKHIPKLVFEEELGSFKPTAVSLDERKKFLIALLEKSIKPLEYVKDEQQQTSTQEKPQVETKPETEQPAANILDDDHDDLPF